jgi:hypothetical protein
MIEPSTVIVQAIHSLTAELVRRLTGSLFTEDQIRSVATHAVGKYFVDWLPEPGAERAARERVEEARAHIEVASVIISGMQSELNAQTEKLDMLLGEIEEKKRLADRYQTLANTNQEHFSAFRAEMEDTLRKELVAQSEKGKRFRQLASLLIGVFNLVAGAALGAYWNDIVAFVGQLFTQSTS